jgi:hypothetical protein
MDYTRSTDQAARNSRTDLSVICDAAYHHVAFPTGAITVVNRTCRCGAIVIKVAEYEGDVLAGISLMVGEPRPLP